MYHPFSIAETIKTAWDIFRKNFATIVVYSAIAVIIIFAIGFFNEFVNTSENFWISLVIFFSVLLVHGYTTLGLYKLIFTLIDKEYYEFEFSQIVPKLRMVLNYISLYIIFAILVVTYKVFVLESLFSENELAQVITQSVVTIIIVYLALRCMFFICFITDDDSGPFESLIQSFSITKGNLLKIITILFIIIALIALPIYIAAYFHVGMLFLCIVVTYPFVNIILATTYRKLVYSHKDIDDDVSEAL